MRNAICGLAIIAVGAIAGAQPSAPDELFVERVLRSDPRPVGMFVQFRLPSGSVAPICRRSCKVFYMLNAKIQPLEILTQLFRPLAHRDPQPPA